ncbi:D-alanyl-D-alanine carboxypeptidase [Marinilongibacter aquaticus]|uniref:D-alanyl-D-alanine carboxypeptidase n=1 Tax=Marinilongibacter aquaticus TaxID=2975157 RepID=UPI0021BD65D5|nr:D-alanyl-D-alanine carboxypeptidase [Marinilongibacter aquaticus]UBM57305.1 D-alanyl-D-alanine carboxypeptidase [Marinilongibacter aquaticus]
MKVDNHLSGYLFFEPSSGDTLLAHNANTYFTPASTTKIFTLFCSLQTIGDSIPALVYRENLDRIWFWGTGDPSLLRSDFPQSQKTIDFLKSKTHKELVFSSANFTHKTYGQGWMWDDFNDDYQTEISSFPLYGNLLHYTNGDVLPAIFADSLNFSPETGRTIHRSRWQNTFAVPQAAKTQNLPFICSPETQMAILGQVLNKKITQSQVTLADERQVIYSTPRDSVLQHMMYVSDNMLAEQLMLVNAGILTDTLDVQLGIAKILAGPLKDLPQKPRWVDGSGLSRYNLISPADLVYVLQKIEASEGQEKLNTYFASNGLQGTLKSFAADEKPFILGKSGSMSGVYNLAGFLKTDSGKTLIFAVMNNNFTQSVQAVRKDVERFLIEVKKQY